MSLRHENDYPIFDGNSGWTSPQYSGGGWSSAGGGGGARDSEGVSYIVDVNNNGKTITTPIIDDDANMRPKDTDTGARPLPNKQFDLETLKQLIKDNPLLAAGIALGLGYVIFGKGGK